MKKLTALLLTMALLLSLLSASIAEVRAAGTTVSYAVEGGNIYFDTSTGTVTGCDRDVTVANIPNDIEGVPVTSIGTYAFCLCESLTSITIPDGVTTIGYGVFWLCNKLTSITIPDSVTTIGDRAFSDCRALTSITIPDSVTSIGYATFSGCSNLASITIPDSVTAIGEDAFSGCEALTSITIPDGVTSIGENAFRSCYALTSITIPDSVTTIGDYAFYNCDSLTSITIGDGVTTIGNSAFYYCEALTSITIPDSVTSIGDSTFYGCDALTSITIGDGVTSIGENAFYYCKSLNGFWVNEGNEAYSSDSNGVLFNKDKTELLQFPYGYSGEYTIPDSVTVIGSRAFECCYTLTDITIPDSVTTIGNRAFERCYALTNIRIGDGVTTIGNSAFYYCEALTSITIPDSVTSIGENAFYYCKSLNGIWVKEENEVYSSDSNGFLFNKNKTELLQCPLSYSGEYTIPDSVTTIGSRAFERCYALTSITVPDSVTTIGKSAFYNCSALTNIILGAGITTIGDYAFYDCEALTSITIPDSVTTIGNSAFYGCCALTSITIPDGVTTIGEDAFYDCDALTSITIPDGVTTIGEFAFYHCDALTSITIPDSVTTIGEYAFALCDALTSITIPDSVTTISNSAFRYCSALTSIIIPDSVTTIGEDAFYHCDALTSITIPDSVTTIDFYAFYGCDRLTDVYYAGTEAQWNNISIGRKNEALLNATIHYNVRPGSTGSPEDPTDPDPAVDGNIKISHTLNLASDIAINFVVGAASLSEYDSYYMECVTPVYEGNTLVGSTTHILEPELRGSYYYFVLDGLTSLDMNDTVEARLCMNKAGKPYISETDHYSIATYAYNQLSGNTTPQALKTVCVNLLQYGAKAQLYKGYRTDTLPDVDLTPEQRAYLTDPMSVEFGSNKAFLGDHTEPTVTFAGVSLRLDSKIVIRYIIDTTAYKGNMEDLSLRVSYEGIDGSIVTETVKDLEVYQEAKNYYAFDFDGLLASELRTVVSAVVYAGDTPVSETMTYSADTYGNGRTGDLLTLVQAMIAYSDSCKAYFA